MLAEQLRQTGMREERVRVVVADVLDHVRATGEDPVEAFGQPADYAAQWAPPLGPGPIVLRILLGALGAAGFFAILYAVQAGGDWTGAVRIRVSDAFLVVPVALVAAVLPWTLDLWVSRRAARRFGAGRDVSTTLVRVVVIVVLFGGPILVGQRLGWMGSETVLFSVPRWVLAVGGAVAAPLVFVVREPRAPSVPRPPGRRPRWWSRLRARLLGSPPRGRP